MPAPQPQGLDWIKSSVSYATGACVELAEDGDRIWLRDSKSPLVCLQYTREEISAFLCGAKLGEFDHLGAGGRNER
jgi:Domain of unknown function (DUF397)